LSESLTFKQCHCLAASPQTLLVTPQNSSMDWKRAQNFVAKRYKKPVPESVYFEDVRLQVRGTHQARQPWKTRDAQSLGCPGFRPSSYESHPQHHVGFLCR